MKAKSTGSDHVKGILGETCELSTLHRIPSIVKRRDLIFCDDISAAYYLVVGGSATKGGRGTRVMIYEALRISCMQE